MGSKLINWLPDMVSMAEVLYRAKRAPSLEDDLPLLLFLPFLPLPLSSVGGGYLPPSGHLSHPETVMDHPSNQVDGLYVYEIAIKAWLSSIKAKYKELAI